VLNFFKMWFAFTIAPLYFGGGGGSSSSSATTNNTDKRLVVSGGVGVSADNSNVTVQALDGGAIKGALDFATSANSANSDNYDKLLQGTGDAMARIFSMAKDTLRGGFDSLAQSQTQAQGMIDTAQSKGTLDNRTITILGISAAVVVGAFALRK